MPKRAARASAKSPFLNGDLSEVRGTDFRNTAQWRIFRIMAEFIDGTQFLFDLKREVTFFGSARLAPSHRWYREARKLGAMLGKAGFTIVTGGGPGIMEAANRGAHETGAESVGINIQLPHEQRTNKWVKKSMAFHYFFTRKFVLSVSAQAYIFFPGGFGTLDEMVEMATLIQTKKVPRVPIVLVGREYWSGLHDWMRTHMLSKGMETIESQDLDLMQIVDTAEEAFAIVKKTKERAYF
ncbi:MAG: TIGR00730 family Rossman fold protein [bacterium]|nr:TIGR00730 family Rossman fold protein [bacterium]